MEESPGSPWECPHAEGAILEKGQLWPQSHFLSKPRSCICSSNKYYFQVLD